MNNHLNFIKILKIARTFEELEFEGLFDLYKKQVRKHCHKSKLKRLCRKIINERYKKSLQFERNSDRMLQVIRKFSKMRECEILSGIYPKRTRKWLRPNKRFSGPEEINFTNFSFIDNPLETLKYFLWLAESESIKPFMSCKLNFMDTNINDISPYFLFGAIHQNLFPFISGGLVNPKLRLAFKALNLDKFMDLKIQDTDKNDKNIFALPIHTRKGENDPVEDIYKVESRDVVTTKVYEQFDIWLAKLSEGTGKLIKMSLEGKSYLAGIIGELLDNSERHANLASSRDDGVWNITCFMEYEEISQKYKCCLSIFNKGDSIAKSIQNAENIEVRIRLEEYIRKHNNINKDLLSTVFAIQDNSTRTKDESHGGWGLMSMVDFIQRISSNKPDEEPNIVIISGDSYIKFSGEYITIPLPKDKDRHQWFNKNNSSDTPPDKNNVFTLKTSLSGTIITTRFYLNKEALTHD